MRCLTHYQEPKCRITWRSSHRDCQMSHEFNPLKPCLSRRFLDIPRTRRCYSASEQPRYGFPETLSIEVAAASAALGRILDDLAVGELKCLGPSSNSDRGRSPRYRNMPSVRLSALQSIGWPCSSRRGLRSSSPGAGAGPRTCRQCKASSAVANGGRP